MRIKKVFNNNVLLAEKNGREVVLIGKGIGFKKHTGDDVEQQQITKIYTPEGDNWIRDCLKTKNSGII